MGDIIEMYNMILDLNQRITRIEQLLLQENEEIEEEEKEEPKQKIKRKEQ